jgi:hypothetical protein
MQLLSLEGIDKSFHIFQSEEVPCIKQCPNVDSPVCGNNKLTYPNMCILQNSICKNPTLKLKHEGICGKFKLQVFELQVFE